jgi:hypothetical protein
MNHLLTKSDIEKFLHQLGERLVTEETLYLIGGSALLLLGSPRGTLDIDYPPRGGEAHCGE